MKKYGDRIIPDLDKDTCSSAPVRVLFPLCGKTVDMAFVATQKSVSEVVGVDGIHKALDEFTKEHPILEIQPSSDPSEDGYERLIGRKIQLIKGDFFNLNEGITGGRFDAVFDRGSLVAIQPSLRESYVQVMKGMMKPGGKILVAALDRTSGTEEALKGGPPFSVPEEEIRRLYEGEDWVESVSLLEEVDAFADRPEERVHWKGRGLDSMVERIFEIKAKN